MKSIFLVGYMGAGKSTIGRKLADELGWAFVDTDVFIEARFRERVVDMFASVGEAVFRRRERCVIEEISGMERTIIATGGGLPCHYDNMDLMNLAGTTLYLSASDETLAQRLELCKRTRPAVKDKSGQELLEYVQQAMAMRRPFYTKAHMEVVIEELRTAEDEQRMAMQIAQILRQNGLA